MGEDRAVRTVLWWCASLVALAGVSAGVGMFIAAGGAERLDAGDKVAGIAGLGVGVASLVVALVSARQAQRSQGGASPQVMAAVLEQLAELVERQWRNEAGMRGLLHPEPLRVRWSSTGRPVQAAAAEVLGRLHGTRPTRLRLDGDVSTVAATWKRLPARQLVVLGAPGSGKTSLAVLLIRALLAGREQGEAVPVMVNVAGWNPRRADFETWFARRVAEDYPSQAAGRRRRFDSLVRLVDRGRVVPVLDGLDEMPADLRPHAIDALNAIAGIDRPVVVTCRSDEYESAIAAHGTPLARAAVVEIAPVTPREAAEYLSSGMVSGATRWAAVTGAMAEDPGGALAEALSTPLMVYLARTAFTPPDTDPAALLTHHTVAEVRERLLDAYVGTVYRAPTTANRRGRAYDARQAQRWLSFLARHLQRRGVFQFSLWSLGRVSAMPAVAWARATLAALLCAGTVGASCGLVLGLRPSIAKLLLFLAASLLALAVTALLLAQCVKPAAIRPSHVRLNRNGSAKGALMGPMMILGFSVVILVPLQLTGVYSPPDSGSTSSDAVLLMLLLAVLGAVVGGLTSAGAPAEHPDPTSTIRRDRTALWTVLGAVLCLSGTTGAVFYTAPMAGAVTGVFLGAVFVVMLGFLNSVGVAWLRYQGLRFWLWSAGVLPWSLAAFLLDAHRRGVLRSVGADYQFRHLVLQQHLARTP